MILEVRACHVPGTPPSRQIITNRTSSDYAEALRLRGVRHALAVVLDLTACAVADRQHTPRYGDLAQPRGRRPATERREEHRLRLSPQCA
jgi:hypothetical protein